MDAYDLQKKIFNAWQDLAHRVDATEINKQWNEVPIYVEVNGEHHIVTDMRIDNNRIILGIK